MTPQMDERLAANRAKWDERTAIHLQSAFYDVEGWLRSGRGPRREEAEALGDVSGLKLVHLQCHFGQDTLAWARAGAVVTGLDFSPAAIAAARDLAERAGLAGRAAFVVADVQDAAAVLGRGGFDVVYVSLGALCWLPSVDRWAEQAAALLAPGGRLFLHDVHPVSWALSEDGERFEWTYFEEAEPYVDDSEETYTDASRPLANRRSYEWNHGLGEIVTAILGQGLQLLWLREHDWAPWQRFPWLEEDGAGHWAVPAGRPRIPLSFSLLAARR